MRYIKKFNENLEDNVSDWSEFLNEISLNFNDINLRLQYNYLPRIESLIITIDNRDHRLGRSSSLFSLSDVKEEIEHIISYMESLNHNLSLVRYQTNSNKYRWSVLYDDKATNRWGVKQSKDFFDIQDYDINTKEID